LSQSRRRSPSSAEVAAVLCVLLVLWVLPAAGQVRVSTIQEVIDRWKPETHLYVIGDVGLQDAVLADLETWLKDRHWTVLLVQDATGQRFQDTEGVVREGEDAIEYGTAQGIARAHGFAGQVRADTGEPDGAILSIVLAQRALYYTGSDAQDSRGLGEMAFQGNLDQWSIAALRNGGDVVSAVKDTVTGIDSQVAYSIGRKREEAASYLAWSRTRVTDVETEVASLEQSAAALRAAPPYPKVGAAQPDTESLRQRIERAKALLDEEKAAEAIAVVDGVHQEVGMLQSNIALYQSYTTKLAAARDRLDRLQSRTLDDAARKKIQGASQLLATAREKHQRGDLIYDQITPVEDAVWDAEAAVRRAEGRRVFSILLGWAALLALAWLAWRLNRRRLPVKKEAEALLASWQTALDRKLEALFGDMEQKVARLAGSFEGETGELDRQVRSDVGSLVILWTSASAVLEQARSRIQPGRIHSVLFNLFLPGNYRKGLALLRDEPVPFDPAEGLPRLFDGERTWRDDLLGDLGSYEPFRKSFEELMAEFHSRAARAGGALDEMETAIFGLPPLLERTRERIWQAEFQKDFLTEAGSRDGLFLAPALFSEVLPAANAALAEAQGSSAADPVGTWKGSAARAERLTTDAGRLAEICRGVRSGAMPALQKAEAGLQSAGIATAWIGEDLRSLSERASELAARAAGEAVSLEIETLAADLDASIRMFEARETGIEERRAETERIAALVPEHEAILEATREAFAESALALGPGDEIHPGADGTVGNNIDEAREEIAAARGKLDEAVAGTRAGRMLAAASLLRQVEWHQEQAGFRLAEISAKRARLDRVREGNRGLLAEMEKRVAKAGPDLSGDTRITEATLSAFEEVAARVRTARGWIDTRKEDPLRAEEELHAARNGLDRVEGALAPADRQLHGEAARGIEEAGRKVDEIGGWNHPYGVAIQGRAGVASLDTARALLGQKRYAEAREAAFAARSEAESALSAALAEVEQRRIEEQEERRRRERERYWNEEIRSRQESSSSSDSSFDSSSSRSSSSSSSSGSSRSSWSGSSSGSGKSRW